MLFSPQALRALRHQEPLGIIHCHLSSRGLDRRCSWKSWGHSKLWAFHFRFAQEPIPSQPIAPFSLASPTQVAHVFNSLQVHQLRLGEFALCFFVLQLNPWINGFQYRFALKYSCSSEMHHRCLCLRLSQDSVSWQHSDFFFRRLHQPILWMALQQLCKWYCRCSILEAYLFPSKLMEDARQLLGNFWNDGASSERSNPQKMGC